jgi:hypothetical protein
MGIRDPGLGAARGRVEEATFSALISALPEEDFGWTIVARPLHRRRALTLAQEAAGDIQAWSGAIRQSVNLSVQSAQHVSHSTQQENRDRIAERAVQWREQEHARFIAGHAEGLWEWSGVLWAQRNHAMHTAARALQGMFACQEDGAEPFNVQALPHMERPQLLACGAADILFRGNAWISVVQSSLLSALLRAPRESYPGFQTAPVPAFSLAGPATFRGRHLALGNIVNRGTRSGHALLLPIDELAGHTLVTGMTGSGKTNTCLTLLREADRNNVPFLVLEPAKTEYRGLLRDSQFTGRLRVYTAGLETASPFRWNPFECPPGYPVSTHLDFLKSVFVASFSMYGPMPHLLEEAIVRVYRERGWDLSTNQNEHAGKLPRTRLFPQMADLLEAVDYIVRASGYAAELTADIGAALRTRVRSLLTGAKGHLFGSATSTPIEDLLSGPTVVELQALGDDQEKAFLMGLILVRLYEHRQTGGLAAGLVHLTLIEEAHRVLKNMDGRTDNAESANTAGKAVETFNNILAEVRAYGEGLLIAEQIPSKLSSDAIKNTGLKLVHRLQAPDDRRHLGEALLLTEPQKLHLGRLASLSAVAFGAGIEEAVLIHLPLVKPELQPSFKPVTSGDVADAMRPYHLARSDVFERYAGCSACTAKCRRPAEVEMLHEDPDAPEHAQLARMALSWGLPGNLRPAAYPMPADDPFRRRCLAANLARYYIGARSVFYGLKFGERWALERALADALDAAPERFPAALATFLGIWRPILGRAWRKRLQICNGCDREFCCGYETERLQRDPEALEDFARAKTDSELHRFLTRIPGKLIGPCGPDVAQALSYCYFVRRNGELGIPNATKRFQRIQEGSDGSH